MPVSRSKLRNSSTGIGAAPHGEFERAQVAPSDRLPQQRRRRSARPEEMDAVALDDPPEAREEALGAVAPAAAEDDVRAARAKGSSPVTSTAFTWKQQQPAEAAPCRR